MTGVLEIGFGKTMRTLATASMVALAVIVIPAAQAYAEPNTGGGTTDNKSCADPEHDGKTLPAGTVWTSTTQNGQVASKYTCNGKTGQWDKMAGPPRSVSVPHLPMGGGYYAQ
jgi:hypothetical protein